MSRRPFCFCVVFVLLLNFLALHASAQTKRTEQHCQPFAEFRRQAESAPDETSRRKVVDELVACAERAHTPLIEPGSKPGFVRAVFLYRGTAAKVALSGDMTNYQPTEVFTLQPGTHLFYLEREYEADARLDYKFVLNDKDWIFDPLNPRTMPSGFGGNSYFAMPDYVSPAGLEENPKIPHGSLEEFTWKSAIRANERQVKVYLPPHYAASRERYAVLYVHDGTDYLNYAKINHLLDHLIALKEIPPVIAVLVPPVDREREYLANPDFARAFATELVTLVDQRYRTRAEPQARCTLGASLGGLISVYLAMSYPQVFGNVIGQSSAFLSDAQFEAVRAAPKNAVKFHLDIGTYEARMHNLDLLDGNRRLRKILFERGHALQYVEVHEGHSWGSWRARIAPALKFIWGTEIKPK